MMARRTDLGDDPGPVAERSPRRRRQAVAQSRSPARTDQWLVVARGELVFVIDADLQIRRAAGAMHEMMQGGADVVYGQRRTRAGESAFKKQTAGLF